MNKKVVHFSGHKIMVGGVCKVEATLCKKFNATKSFRITEPIGNEQQCEMHDLMGYVDKIIKRNGLSDKEVSELVNKACGRNVKSCR